jgi:hypothetical protein
VLIPSATAECTLLQVFLHSDVRLAHTTYIVGDCTLHLYARLSFCSYSYVKSLSIGYAQEACSYSLANLSAHRKSSHACPHDHFLDPMSYSPSQIIREHLTQSALGTFDPLEGELKLQFVNCKCACDSQH